MIMGGVKSGMQPYQCFTVKHHHLLELPMLPNWMPSGIAPQAWTASCRIGSALSMRTHSEGLRAQPLPYRPASDDARRQTIF